MTVTSFPSEKTDDYSFEISPEVALQMQQAADLHLLISEEDVGDLHAIDISNRMYIKVKRLLDVILSFLGLSVLVLPFAIIAVCICLDSPGSIFFSQYRVGRNGKRFKLYKFRTMTVNTPKYLSTNNLGESSQYVTRFGKFLRKFSLDELPQLFNVLKGEMSLVGPRPLISDEYEIHERRMHFGVYQLRPGVTGLAQINGRDFVTAAEKVRWDVKYLESFGFWTDLEILLKTIPKAFSAVGVSEGSPASQNPQ
ncbi:MAG: sugar transferase [Oscillospiraceae bacterium]|nr:sugar transferase [Oscillospiraceae bacterium]